MVKAAIFDIDGTVFRGSLMENHFKYMVKYDLIPENINLKQIKPLEEAWLNRELDYDTYLIKLVTVYQKAIKGLDESDVKFVARQVIKNESKKLYVTTRNAIEQHKKEGFKIILISGSPDFLVSLMADYLDADLYFGTTYLKRNKKYTGSSIPMWDSLSKTHTIDRLVEEHDIDLEESYAYGDTNGDFLMLSRVGHPVAINPNRELLERLKTAPFRDRVKLIIERKDVTYNIKIEDLLN